MKYLTLILALFLTACGSSDDDSLLATVKQLPPNESTQVAALQAKVDSLQAQIDKFKELQLIGKVHGITIDSVGRMVDAIGNPVSFGPCADMGVLVGFTNGNANTPADPLTAQSQAFKQCTGYYYEVNAADGSLTPTQRLYFDGPNCTGNMFVWNASGTSFNDQVLKDGVVFSSAIDGTDLMAKAGQTPAMTQAQSVYIIANGGCTADGDLQPMFAVTPNDSSITGIPGSVGVFQLTSP